MKKDRLQKSLEIFGLQAVIDAVHEGKEFDKIFMEKGLNTYMKVSDSLCNKAKDWWKDHKTYWFQVREVWDEVYGMKAPLSFKKKSDGSTLWQKLFELDDQFQENPEKAEVVKKEVKNYCKKTNNPCDFYKFGPGVEKIYDELKERYSNKNPKSGT